jgi:hypothetical protein
VQRRRLLWFCWSGRRFGPRLDHNRSLTGRSRTVKYFASPSARIRLRCPLPVSRCPATTRQSSNCTLVSRPVRYSRDLVTARYSTLTPCTRSRPEFILTYAGHAADPAFRLAPRSVQRHFACDVLGAACCRQPPLTRSTTAPRGRMPRVRQVPPQSRDTTDFGMSPDVA